MRPPVRILTAVLVAAGGVLAAACVSPGDPPTVFEETEPNDGGLNDPGNAVDVPLPVRLTGEVQSGDPDRFILDLPAADAVLDFTCSPSAPVTISIFDSSLGQGSAGGCGSSVTVSTDGGEVLVTISSAETTSYAVDIFFAQA